MKFLILSCKASVGAGLSRMNFTLNWKNMPRERHYRTKFCQNQKTSQDSIPHVQKSFKSGETDR